MKLIFSKDENGDIGLKIQKGTIAIEFTYIEMIRQLLEKNTVEDTDFGNLNEEEKLKINAMLVKICAVFEPETPAT